MKNLEKQAMEIVAQLFDLAEVPVDKRQEINDVAYDYVTEQLIITDVGCSNIHSPYLTSEKNYQIKKMEKLGINTKCCTFEQSVNGLIYMLEEYKESE
tara:strand:- start:308 stop:601 length:294 start_codon:yes stop_codon:yes gene_type:complete